jgi:hypothetical protein
MIAVLAIWLRHPEDTGLAFGDSSGTLFAEDP